MPLLTTIDELTYQHLQDLVDHQTGESKRLDYKRDLPKRDDRGKNDFIADVAAFANSSGGDLLYGVEEDGEGRAKELVGLEGNRDEEVRRLQDYVLNNIDPRVPGIQIRAISAPDRYFIVVRVPQSWTGPHRVNTNQHFYIREDGRKRTLNVPEIRSHFLRTEGQAERVRSFRTERLGKIIAGEAPHPLVPGAVQLIHLVPTQAALDSLAIDPVPYSMSTRQLPLLGTRNYSTRLNADGVLAVRYSGDRGTHGYTQLYRSGFFETARVLTAEDGRYYLPSYSYEEEMISLVKAMRVEFDHLGFGTEMLCMMSIHGPDKVELGINRGQFLIEDVQGKFDRSTLVLPDILLPADVEADQALRPLFDLVWQSAGLPRSYNYDKHGIWLPR